MASRWVSVCRAGRTSGVGAVLHRLERGARDWKEWDGSGAQKELSPSWAAGHWWEEAYPVTLQTQSVPSVTGE